MKRSVMLLGAAAVVASAGAAGAYRDVTNTYMKNSAFIPGWQGALTATKDGVAECYNGAFNLYQTLSDMPEGEYTLSVDAFYRCGTNDFAKANMTDGKLHNAYIYINGTEKPVLGLFDGRETAPNSTGEANTAFTNGEYVNTITVQHPGGDMVVGIKSLGCYNDEWCCFDNFSLMKGAEDYTSKIINADFVDGLNNTDTTNWNQANVDGLNKNPDVNKGGGVYRKSNASPFNVAQQVELPVGKYRFSVLTFCRYGGPGNLNGKIVSAKGAWGLTENKSAKDYYDENYSTLGSNEYGYLFMSYNEEKPTNFDEEDLSADYGENDVLYRLKDVWQICEGDYANMPDNETRVSADETEIVPAYETANVVPGWCDSGSEREAAAAFVSTPDKYRHVAEFELDTPAKVWLGLSKQKNSPAAWWCPWADFKLEYFDPAYEAAGVEGVAAEAIDVNAPAEYYNLQGMRVEPTTTGLYIVKQGNKVAKQLIRK